MAISRNGYVHQVMTEEESREFKWNPFDITKVWYQAEFPLLKSVKWNSMKFKKLFAHVEQSLFRQII